jgi:Kef-type K+ transport system membrane component KefB
MANLSTRSRRLFDALSRTDPPLYAIFFVIAGADLNLALLPTLGVLGGVYVLGRAVGKFVGTRYATRYVGLGSGIQRLMGLAMLSQAGLAIGLVLVTTERFPTIGPIVATIVLASVAMFELVGPLGARFALEKSGEVRPPDPASAVLLD